jgi:hypothetical protein
MSRISSPFRHSTYVLLAVGLLVALTSCSISMSKPPTSGEADRVAKAFAKISADAKQKDGVAPTWSIPKLAAKTSLPDREKATLWVASEESKGILTRGYYLDIVRNKPKRASGMSLWGRPTQQVSLDRSMPPIVIGNVGSWPAKTVRVIVGGTSIDLPVSGGYFLIPSERTTNISQKFTITLLNKTGAPIGTVSDLSAPGSGTPH